MAGNQGRSIWLPEDYAKVCAALPTSVVGALQAMGFQVYYVPDSEPDPVTDFAFRCGVGMGDRTFVETWREDATRRYIARRVQLSDARGMKHTNSPVFTDGVALLVWIKAEGWI